MFVQTNSIRAVREYFKDRLGNSFSESEKKQMFKSAVMERLKLSSSEFLLSDDKLLSESDLLYFRSIVKRLQSNEPFQYIIGETEFYGLNLKTDKRALIPRPETEELVNWVVEDYKHEKDLRILDLCTGSGCIALALKSAFTDAYIYGLDVSFEALSLSKENASRNNLEIEFFEYDLINRTDKIYPHLNNFDIWISNPPYIPEKDKELMSENVLEFEPHIALFVSNTDPLVFYRLIGEKGKSYLKKGGSLYFEIHENLSKEVEDLLRSLDYSDIESKMDLQGRYRMVKAVNR